MKILKQILINSATTIITILIIGSAYAAISTVSSGDPLTADSWNQIVNKINNTDTNSTDLVTKSYVDSTISANSGGGYPVTKWISNLAPSTYSHIQAVTYCRNLNEWWFDDWRLPTQEELSLYTWIYTDALRTTTIHPNYTNSYVVLYLSNGNIGNLSYNQAYYTRCVR